VTLHEIDSLLPAPFTPWPRIDFVKRHRNQTVSARNGAGDRQGQPVDRLKMEEVTFSQVLTETVDRRRDLLLGNGFSIAAHDHFAYPSLYRVAIEHDASLVDLFAELGTQNFEVALYAASDPEDSYHLRKALYDAVVRVHPVYGQLGPTARQTCGVFLEDFTAPSVRGRVRGTVFTTNYDLMLYWVIVGHAEILRCWDGFDADCVWKPGRAEKTSLYFLHGALHIHQRPMGVAGRHFQIRKLRHSDRGSLLVQVKNHLERAEYPLLVSEAEPAFKQAIIGKNPYLRAAHEAFQTACDGEKSTLVVIGHGLGEMDTHITDAVARGLVGSVYVSTFSKDDKDRASVIAAEWSQTRQTNGGPPVTVKTFDVRDCPMWSRSPSNRRLEPAAPLSRETTGRLLVRGGDNQF
jgi:hypothetical protein